MDIHGRGAHSAGRTRSGDGTELHSGFRQQSGSRNGSYRSYKADKNLFAAQAAVVSHPESSGIPNIHSVPGSDDFTTEDEARDYIIGAAKKSIDVAHR